MKKIMISGIILLFFFAGCSKSWNGLQFKYSEINTQFNNLPDLKSEKNIEFSVVKYGTSEMAQSAVFLHGNPNLKTSFDWLFYVIKSDNFILLIDTGFQDKKYIKAFNIVYKNPVDLLADMGITPSEVTHVILTHSHFDHAGSVQLFENAEIFIQKDAFYDILQNYSRSSQAIFLKSTENVTKFVRSVEILDYFLVKMVGGHSPGSSSVGFRFNGNNYLVVGDEAYLYKNILEQIPVGTYLNKERNISYLKELESFNGRILTFHDISIGSEQLGVKQLWK